MVVPLDTLAMHFTRDMSGKYLEVQVSNLFKHICSLPLFHRPKGVLLVIAMSPEFNTVTLAVDDAQLGVSEMNHKRR